jgi:hypothetical protein
MSYKTLVSILLFFGIIMVIISVSKELMNCPKNKVIYRFIPRTFDEEMENPEFVTDVFATMFSQPSPWLGSIQNFDRKKTEQINKYFISQI